MIMTVLYLEWMKECLVSFLEFRVELDGSALIYDVHELAHIE
jgi:hypothetical protein